MTLSINANKQQPCSYIGVRIGKYEIAAPLILRQSILNKIVQINLCELCANFSESRSKEFGSVHLPSQDFERIQTIQAVY